MGRLVKFDNGTYGVRAGWLFGWRFRDLTTPGFCWHRGSAWFFDCQGTKERAVKAMNGHGTNYKVISEDPS